MIENFLAVEPGIWRGGQPQSEDWSHIKQLGITFVLKLDTDVEGSDEAASGVGLQVIKMPIDWMEQILGEPPHDFLSKTTAIIQTCALPLPDGGIYVHCKHGQDRTGLIIGAYRVACGWTKQRAYEEMITLGFHPLLRGLCWAWDAVLENTSASAPKSKL